MLSTPTLENRSHGRFGERRPGRDATRRTQDILRKLFVDIEKEYKESDDGAGSS
jgi:hypothetical protein